MLIGIDFAKLDYKVLVTCMIVVYIIVCLIVAFRSSKDDDVAMNIIRTFASIVIWPLFFLIFYVWRGYSAFTKRNKYGGF